MKSCPIASRCALLLLFTITVIESNAIPLTIRRHSFDRPSLLASQTFRHALMSSRMLTLLPRNHESQYGGFDAKYDGEGDRGDEGTRDSRWQRQQEDRYGNEREMKDNGILPGHNYSSSGSGDWDEGTSGTSGGFHEGLEDERVGSYSSGSPGDSEADRFSNAPTNSGSRPEHNHPGSGSTHDNPESDQVPTSPQMHHTDDQPHEPSPVSHQGQEPSLEETTLSKQAAPSSLANEDTPSVVCSTLSQLYQRLDGPAWHNQEGWKGTTASRQIRIRNHEGSRENQHSFETTAQTEADTMEGQDESQVDESSTDMGRASDMNEGPMVVKENSSDPSCCSWFGVTCRGSRVVGLALAGNGLDGPYPTDIVQRMVDLETV